MAFFPVSYVGVFVVLFIFLHDPNSLHVPQQSVPVQDLVPGAYLILDTYLQLLEHMFSRVIRTDVFVSDRQHTASPVISFVCKIGAHCVACTAVKLGLQASAF